MKINFIRIKSLLDLFLLLTLTQTALVVFTMLYYFNFYESFYAYTVSLYFNEFSFIVNKTAIFIIGVVGSFWTYINYKKTRNIQFIFYYCFNIIYVLEPFKILLSYFIIMDFKDEFYFLTKIYYFFFLYSLFNLFSLSIYIGNFKIKSLNFTIFQNTAISALFTALVTVNSYDYNENFNFLLRIENIKFYMDLVLFIILFNFLMVFIKKSNFAYFTIFISIFLILAGTYLNFLKINYSFVPIYIGMIMYLRKSGKLFFYWT